MDYSAGVGPNLASLWCRPAALENLDHNQVHININIPGPVRKAVDQNPSAYYFATVQRVRTLSLTLYQKPTLPVHGCSTIVRHVPTRFSALSR